MPRRRYQGGAAFHTDRDNARDLPDLLQLLDDEGLDKFYLSHLNYAGRGNKNRGDDAHHQMTRAAMDLLFDTCWNHIVSGDPKEFVTGNNDADGAYLTQWVARNLPTGRSPAGDARTLGGNSSGINIANIDNLGGVHPDTMVGLWSGQRQGQAVLRKSGKIPPTR